MSQIWFFFAGLLIVASARSASSPGSCASIGYSTRCCPPSEGNNCQATDGSRECFCNPDCHIYGDCCEDVHCPAQPKNCTDNGITQCCSDPSGTGNCDVHFRDSDNNRCSCNASCHERNDCCPDAQEFCIQPRTCKDVGITRCCNDPSGTGHCDVRLKDSDNFLCSCNASCHERNDCCPDAREFCMPKTCNGAGKYPNCCKSNSTDIRASACHVPGGNCYCDPLCKYFDDCCDDAPKECLKSSESDESIQQSRLQSFRNRKVLSRRRFYNRGQRIHQQRANANYVYEEAPADQQVQLQGFNYMNQREFRGKRHVNGQPSA